MCDTGDTHGCRTPPTITGDAGTARWPRKKHRSHHCSEGWTAPSWSACSWISPPGVPIWCPISPGRHGPSPPSARAIHPRLRPWQRPPPIDLQAVEKQVRAIFRGNGGGYIGDAVADAAPLLDQVRASLLAGDARTALAVLALLTTHFTDRYEDFEDPESDGGDFVVELGALWIEGLLAVDLPAG